MSLRRPKGYPGTLVILELKSAIGDYADYLTREIIPFVDREFRTLAGREHHGRVGKSSGGYGAIIHGMKYPKVWGAIADHSGDACFDFVYRHDWPNARSPSAARPSASPAFTTRTAKRAAKKNLCMAATYDPDPRAPLGFRIPFTPNPAKRSKSAGATGAATTRST